MITMCCRFTSSCAAISRSASEMDKMYGRMAIGVCVLEPQWSTNGASKFVKHDAFDVHIIFCSYSSTLRAQQCVKCYIEHCSIKWGAHTQQCQRVMLHSVAHTVSDWQYLSLPVLYIWEHQSRQQPHIIINVSRRSVWMIDVVVIW